eukprot:scaffold118787_cov23-Tisochrysis_lutea.AAC.1
MQLAQVCMNWAYLNKPACLRAHVRGAHEHTAEPQQHKSSQESPPLCAHWCLALPCCLHHSIDLGGKDCKCHVQACVEAEGGCDSLKAKGLKERGGQRSGGIEHFFGAAAQCHSAREGTSLNAFSVAGLSQMPVLTLKSESNLFEGGQMKKGLWIWQLVSRAARFFPLSLIFCMLFKVDQRFIATGVGSVGRWSAVHKGQHSDTWKGKT